MFSVIGCWFVKKDKIVRVIIVTGALSVLSINVFWTRTLDRVLYFAVFYFTGIYIRMKYEKILVKLSKVWILVIAFISFVVCNIIICLMVLNADFRVVKVVECFVKLLGAVSGSYLLWCFSLLLSRTKTRAYKFWDFIGKYSMDIYMFAEPIKVISRTVFSVFPLTIMVILTFGTSVIGAIVCSKMIVRRVALLRKVFLGA